MVKTFISQVSTVVWLLLLTTVPARTQAVDQVATEPQFVSRPELQFPNAAYMGRVTGTVWLKLLIGADGIPIKTEILRRDPEMAFLFDNNARKWGMGCRFTPALDSSGRPVSTWEVIPLSFRLDHFTPPQCTNQSTPEYPAEARAMGIEGWVGLAVLVKSNGEVDDTQILVVGRYPENMSIFEKAAKDAAYHSQFRPAAYESGAVEGWCFIKVSFLLTPGINQKISTGE